jgi:hypothetical protein
MSSILIDRMRLARRLGKAFHGYRDYYDVYGYPKLLDFDFLLGKYQRQDIAGRIVDMPPEALWAYPPAMSDFGGVKAKWDAFISKLSLWTSILQADRLCAFGSYAIIWLGLPGNQETPAPKVTDVNSFLYAQAYGGDASYVRVLSYEDNTSNPRFGQPVMYQVRVGPWNAMQTIRVHYSRLIHIVDKPLQGTIFAEPRLARVYNTLDDLLKVTGGSAETYWLTANRGMQFDVDKEMELDETDAAALQAEVDEFQHQLRRILRTRGVTVKELGSEVADPRGVFDVLMSILASATSIPQRMLMGSEAGQLASEQDRANWAEFIERRRRTFAEPFVLKPILSRLVDLSYLPAGTVEKANLGTDDSVFSWPNSFHMSPLEQGNIIANLGRAVVNLARRNQFGNPVISDEQARDILRMLMKLMPRDKVADETYPKAPKSANAGGGGGGGGGGAPNSPSGQPGQQPHGVATPPAATRTGAKA